MKRLIHIVLLVPLWFAPGALAQHYHLNTGALSQVQDTPLFFQNENQVGTNSGLALPLTFKTNGPYSGYYHSGSLSPTAIGTGFLNPPAPGTQVRLRFLSVTGPVGGSIGVWDVNDIFNDDDQYVSTNLTFSVPVGTTNGTQSIRLSQNNGEPGADPFGHIHGRQFSATRPGLYVVTVQAYDASTNGSGGGPIHLPSDPLPIYFQAGNTIAALERTPADVTLGFATKLGSDYYLEATPNLATNEWETVAGPFPGNDHLQSAIDPNANERQRFYRLRLVPSP